MDKPREPRFLRNWLVGLLGFLFASSVLDCVLEKPPTITAKPATVTAHERREKKKNL